MYETSESRMYPGVTAEELSPQICIFWLNQEFNVDQISPNQIYGLSKKERGYLKEEIYIWLNYKDNYLFVDLTFRAEKTEEWEAHRISDYALINPAVLGIGKVTEYSAIKKDFKKLMKKFWSYIDHTIDN